MIQVQRTAEEQMEILMGIVLDLQKEVYQVSRKMAEMITVQVEERVDKALESKSEVIGGRLALRDIVKLRQLLQEKDIITEDEFIAKLKEK